MKYLTFKLKSLDSSLSRQQKRLILTSFDTIFFLVSISSAFVFRFGFQDAWKEIFKSSLLVLLLLSIKIPVFQKMGMYRPILRYTGFEFILTALKAVLISSGTLAVLTYLLQYLPVPADLEASFLLPGTVLINDAFLTLLFIAGIRLAMRYAADSVIALANGSNAAERVVIYGAGSCGSQLAQALAQNHAYRLVAFVDDDVFLHKHLVQGLTVYSPAYLPELKTKKDFDTILLAMPSIDGLRKQEILDNLQDLAVKVKTVPSISEILSGQVSISRIRNIEIADLLGREQVAPVQELLQMDVTDKAVLVTGAGGSIGSELCRQIAKQQPKCLVLY
ncbi:MAG TPA: polysaccharide biosynthesis protein, partial [Candidatus Obscuribacterales bacterium]